MRRIRNRSEDHNGNKGRSEFVKAHSNPSKLLEAVEESFNDITELVNIRIVCSQHDPIGTWRNYRDSFTVKNVLNDFVAVVSTIPKDKGVLHIDGFKERDSVWRVMLLSRRQRKSPNDTVSIH